MRSKRLSAALLGAATVLISAGLAPTAGAAPAAAVQGPDFNGDGYADAVVGVYRGDVDGQKAAGYLHVLYGGPSGAGTSTASVSQDTPGVPGTSEKNDQFGGSVATADVDGDGFTDAVVGVGGEDVGSDPAARGHGAVVVLYGSSSGRFERGRTIAQGSAGSGAGASLAVGDFTQDGDVDVAVGLPHGEFGEVTLRPGPLTEDKPLTHLLDTGFGGSAGQLAAGDFDGNGKTDLAVSAYSNDYSRTTLWSWNGSALQEYWKSPATGYDIATGDFDGDSVDDLALGHCLITAEADRPTGACGPDALAKGGKVRVFYGGGGAEGFGTRSQTVGQDTPGVAGTAEQADNFGIQLAAGDLNGDGRDDLVAGTPGEAIGTQDRAGSATVLTSGPDGLLDASGTAKSAAWHQGSAGVPGAPEVNDEFGSALALGDYDGDGDGDVTVGAYNENSTEYEQSLSTGGVWALPNGTGTGSKALTPRLFGLRGALYYGHVLGR
ncbi:FG-GAP and VCBS repeat-containing protein [Streptomyces sp. NPDC057302]|uniref:FG-GAP and VCBS repeat-containing protein n=1 Tax=Streptomyces sp. NPDC057302 TaxID=3346094 RepID=UPI003636C3BC